MEAPFVRDDEEAKQIYKLSAGYFVKGDYIKALELTEDSVLSYRKRKKNVSVLHNFQQGKIFSEMAKRTENSDVKVAFTLGSAECFSGNRSISSFCAASLFGLGSLLGSSLYYKKSIDKAKEYLRILASLSSLTSAEQQRKIEIEDILKFAESEVAAGSSSVEKCQLKFAEPKKYPDPRKIEVKGLRSYWMGLNVEMKREFMKVSTADFTSFVHRLYGPEGRDALIQVLTSAREDKKWRFWMCRSCSQKFSSTQECKNHLEKEHDAALKPSSTKDMAQMISKLWARKISDGGWEPVDAVAAVEKIKNQLQDVKAFAYVNGWSKDWPLAADEQRSKLLQDIKSLLVSFWDCKILSCTIRDWVMHFVVNHLENLQVSKDTLTDCRLVETPQSICFLECRQLNQILEFLRNIKCERDDGTGLVCRAVDSFYSGTQVKEKMDFDIPFSFLLLDKRLLQGKIARFDGDGTISFVDHNVHYAKAHAHGDDILSWLTDYCPGEESFRFPRPFRTHNLDIWLAVLKAVHFTCRTLRTKFIKKEEVLHYDAFLIFIKKLCISEDGRRRNIPEDQWNTYASLICDECEKQLRENAGDVLKTKMFFSRVRDVLEGASYPTFDNHDSQDSLNVIRERKNLSDDRVLKSIDLLKLAVTNKVPLIDSKILLIENSRVNLLNYLTRLSVFDYRSYILPPLKEFLLDEIVNIESKAKLAAAEADLLLEEGKKSLPKKKKNKSNKEELDGIVNLDAKAKVKEMEKNSGSKKKKHRSIKRTSTSMSSLLDQNIKHESSVNLEPIVTSPSLKTAAEDTFSSNTNNQEEATKDMQNMPGEDSPSEHSGSVLVEGAARCNSALDMTLKALCNIKVLEEYLVHNQHQFADNLEEHVASVLQNFFTAFLSNQIKEKGLHSYLLGNLLASLKEVHSMSSDAAELLVSILEFWPRWKSPQIESVVTRIFTLEEYERMSCSKCRKKPNYPEQSSYGIVMAADSIRDLKCAFGNIKFENILKVIRMEDKMLCDIKTGGCGKENFVHHIINRCPPIFTIVLEWEKDETEKEISETTKALDWEIDISRLYQGLEPKTMYRLVSMVGCGEEEEHICLAYKNNRWISLKHEALVDEDVGNWKSVVSFYGERKVRPEILFYEAVRSMA